jgi:hypothetical protein
MSHKTRREEIAVLLQLVHAVELP